MAASLLFFCFIFVFLFCFSFLLFFAVNYVSIHFFSSSCWYIFVLIRIECTPSRKRLILLPLPGHGDNCLWYLYTLATASSVQGVACNRYDRHGIVFFVIVFRISLFFVCFTFAFVENGNTATITKTGRRLVDIIKNVETGTETNRTKTKSEIIGHHGTAQIDFLLTSLSKQDDCWQSNGHEGIVEWERWPTIVVEIQILADIWGRLR